MVDRERLRALERQRRVHLHLDWWSLDEWLASDALVTTSDGGELLGGMLAVPVDMADSKRLASARSDAAWLRWCALADGAPATPVLRGLFATLDGRLAANGVSHIFCAITRQVWLTPYLADAGFGPHDEVVTLTRRVGTDPEATAGPATIRQAIEADLDGVAALDGAAFEPEWRYSRDVLRRALHSAERFRVIVCDGALAGYYFVAAADGNAHLTRIAVHPAAQGRGIGRALMRDALRESACAGAVTMSLNTQTSNSRAQRLYERFGFRRIGHHLKILRRSR